MAQTFRQAIAAKLAAIPEVTAIVGSSIYPGVAPTTHDFRRDGPALTYSIPDDVHDQCLAGAVGTSQAHVTFTGYSYLYSDVDSIALAIFNAINGVPGVWGTGGTAIVSVTHQGDSDEEDPLKDSSDNWKYSIESEYLIKYRIPIPTLS